MSPLWVLPLLIVAAGTTLVAFAARKTAVAAGELAQSAAALGDLSRQATALRADADALVARSRQLSWRGSATTDEK